MEIIIWAVLYSFLVWGTWLSFRPDDTSPQPKPVVSLKAENNPAEQNIPVGKTA